VKREVQLTADGSPTVSIPEMNVSYHSLYGALQESQHVFLKCGLEAAWERFPEEPVHLFEMGFGTGLNAFLTARAARQMQRPVQYTSLELYPLSAAETSGLDYDASEEGRSLFRALHEAAWEVPVPIDPCFTLHKVCADLHTYRPAEKFHLIYYDAFAPRAQPELWSAVIFRKLYEALHPGGLLTTYCSKVVVQRALREAGFRVEKLAGPKWKREILRAEKS
jgi:tRNA U34 5-methylaminomethyl-2-thiouridine-forming methyltransferase MnmC